MGKKQQMCTSCKKSPVWRGGDVKDPGPFCKKCYHKGKGFSLSLFPRRRTRKSANAAIDALSDEDYELLLLGSDEYENIEVRRLIREGNDADEHKVLDDSDPFEDPFAD